MQALNAAFSSRAARTSPTVCATLARDELCLPCELARSETPAVARRRVPRNGLLHLQGDAFTAAYAVRAGSFKTVVHGEDGGEQVVGFHVGAEVLGLEGLARHRYEATAMALEDSEVLVVPLADAAWWSGARPELQYAVTRLVSRELLRERERRQLLTNHSADARVASFLLEMAKKMQARGWSGSEFQLRMTRGDMASYLGLKLETVSRAFTRLCGERLMAARGREVRLLDLPALERLAGPAAA